MILYIVNGISLSILFIIIFFQVLNAIKYQNSDGAIYTRVMLMGMVVCFIIHIIRLIVGISTGFFLMFGIIAFAFIYTNFFKK